VPFWVSPWPYGLKQGPIVLMIENFRSGLLWRLMRQCPYLIRGLRRAGFTGGWLETRDPKRPRTDDIHAKAPQRRFGANGVKPVARRNAHITSNGRLAHGKKIKFRSHKES